MAVTARVVAMHAVTVHIIAVNVLAVHIVAVRVMAVKVLVVCDMAVHNVAIRIVAMCIVVVRVMAGHQDEDKRGPRKKTGLPGVTDLRQHGCERRQSLRDPGRHGHRARTKLAADFVPEQRLPRLSITKVYQRRRAAALSAADLCASTDSILRRERRVGLCGVLCGFYVLALSSSLSFFLSFVLHLSFFLSLSLSLSLSRLLVCTDLRF